MFQSFFQERFSGKNDQRLRSQQGASAVLTSSTSLSLWQTPITESDHQKEAALSGKRKTIFNVFSSRQVMDGGLPTPVLIQNGFTYGYLILRGSLHPQPKLWAGVFPSPLRFPAALNRTIERTILSRNRPGANSMVLEIRL